MKLSRQWGVAIVGMCMTAGVWAAQPVVVYEAGAIKVTDRDVRVEVERLPDAMRQRVLDNPQTLEQVAKTLAARRALAQQAEGNGLANKPETKEALKIAREKVLSDLRLAQFDAEHAPDAKKIDDIARTQYRANPKAFEMPAQAHVRHILSRGDTPEAKAKAEKVLAELKAGGDFEKLAKQYSDDPANAEKGGDLGFSSVGRFVPEFEKAVEGLTKDGQTSDLVKTQFGWHIIQLVERRPASVVPYEDVAERLRADAKNKLLTEKRVELTDGLVKDAKVNEEALKAMGSSK